MDHLLVRSYQALEDKVRDGPLTEDDIKMVFEIHIAPRLERLQRQLGIRDPVELKRLEDYIFSKLREKSELLNSQYWSK